VRAPRSCCRGRSALPQRERRLVTQVDSATEMTDNAAARERALLAVTRDLLRELRPRHAATTQVALKSRLDRDLGIDSLGRTELILRVERAMGVRLPPNVLGEAETVGDILHALEESRPAQRRISTTTLASPLALVPAAAEAGTLIEVLDQHAAHHPDRRHVTVLQDETTETGTMTFGELAAAGRAVAAGLVARDIVPGDRIALMLPTSLDFFSAFFGVLYAGAVPVPIYPPARLGQLEEHLRRQAGILRNAGARILITVPQARGVAALLRGQVETLMMVIDVASLAADSRRTPLPAVADGGATALIQYTSGSTGDPKGVVLSHANLLANIRAMGTALEAVSTDVFVSWLPLYHDMGLIGAWLGSLYFAVPLYAMSPLAFLARPQSWLWAIHRYRGTLSVAPNFAYDLCANRIDDADIDGLDLSSLRILANGAEPITAGTIARFIERFARYGLRREAVAPVYGLAECAVGLAFPPLNRGPVIDRVSEEALRRRGIAEPAASDAERVLEIVACGQPIPGHEVRIVDDLGLELGERREGRLQFRGPSATSGYYRNEAKTRELIRYGWHDSGDRAYMAGGDIFITGRIKDIIIRAGRNIYPHELEEALGNIAGIRKGCVAAFGTGDPAAGTERLVILAETRETDAAARAALVERAHEVATDILGAPPDEIVLAPPRTVQKTSSGKIRRSAAKAFYESGRLSVPQRAVWWQIVRLALAAAGPQILRLARMLADFIYAAWWWLVVALGFTFGWLAVMILPRRRWRWAAVRGLARATLAAVGARLAVTGRERLSRRGGVLACNHASYIDVVALAAIVPGEPAFMAKKEFASQIFAAALLRRVGALFVERFDTAGSLADAEAATEVARQARLIVVFPEGTFTRRAGLSGFYLGAFKIASEAGLPILPTVLRGTRSMLRGEQWFPRRAAISAIIAEPIAPSGNDFTAMLRLRDAVRAVMLEHCGEPDLAELAKPEPPRRA
jgi:1-acyl-sn-glycerol-3-phosphate acyltransferase